MKRAWKVIVALVASVPCVFLDTIANDPYESTFHAVWGWALYR